MASMWARPHLPWRNLPAGKAGTKDPYKILVSEIMLQQTQVERVIPFYNRFIKKYPTARALSRASLRDVLKMWHGLGYNRRAKFLHQAAKQLVKPYFPKTAEEIEKLPGVGHYTARAIAAFAFNKPEVFIETNIRTVLLHRFYSSVLQKTAIADEELLPLVAETLKRSKMEPRDFYAAMMDYGAHLKKQGVKLNSRSKHYTKQSKFEGSARQLRGAILRELLMHQATLSMLLHRIPRNQQDVAHELTRLVAEGLIKLHGRFFSVAD